MEEQSKIFSSSNFNAEKYVKEISQRCVGGSELQQQRLKLQAVADETNNFLKKNVFENYTLFIDTAKEISRLEGDMYQLSHLLSEQKSLLATLASSSVVIDKESVLTNDKKLEDSFDENSEEKRKRLLQDIFEKIEGCINLTEEAGRTFLYEGDLVELDVIDNTPVVKIHCYLLSDVVLLTEPIRNRRTPAWYKLRTVYDIGNVAVVNAKTVKNGFKLLAFPDTKLFQTPDSQTKKEWLTKFEEARKIGTFSESKKRNSIISVEKSPIRSDSLDSSYNNPFDECDENNEEEDLPEWVLEVVEDLDVLIVERHFEDAYSLIEKARTFLKDNHVNSITAQDISGKVEVRVKTLTDVLTRELEISAETSNQGGLRAARRAVKLLNTLHMSTQACDLFLKLCSNLLKTQMKRIRRESSSLTYVKQLSVVFFSNLRVMATEFQYKAFPNNPSCASAFVIWCTHEVNHFMSQLIRNVFTSQLPVSHLAQCVECIHTHCQQLCSVGLDMLYQIDGELRTPLTKCLHQTRDKLIEEIKLKSQNDQWHPMNLKRKQLRDKLISEFNSLGFTALVKYCKDECFLELTENVVIFCRSLFSYLNDCFLLHIANIAYDIEQTSCDLLISFIRHVNNSLYNEKLKSKEQCIKTCIRFFLEEVFPFCQNLYKKYDLSCTKLRQIETEFKDSTSRNVTVVGYV